MQGNSAINRSTPDVRFVWGREFKRRALHKVTLNTYQDKDGGVRFPPPFLLPSGE